MFSSHPFFLHSFICLDEQRQYPGPRKNNAYQKIASDFTTCLVFVSSGLWWCIEHKNESPHHNAQQLVICSCLSIVSWFINCSKFINNCPFCLIVCHLCRDFTRFPIVFCFCPPHLLSTSYQYTSPPATLNTQRRSCPHPNITRCRHALLLT